MKVNVTPSLARPNSGKTIADLANFDLDFHRTVFNEFLGHARALNTTVKNDGSEPMTAPFTLVSYTVATLPTASLWSAGMIYVSDETGGAVPAFSDGTNWRRVTDRNIVS